MKTSSGPLAENPQAESQDFPAGIVISSSYRVLRKLGSGGNATVYLADDLQLHKEVALKVWHHWHQTESDKFRREARISAKLQHRNIVQVRAFGLHQDLPFLVMEHIDGQTLEEYLAIHKTVQPAEALPLLRGVAAALQYAHENNVLHRDIKPANIMLESGLTSEPKLLDFGLARALENNGQSTTMTSAIAGSPHYMSPEQCKGEPLDARSDIYSLGATMFQALTGRTLFTGDTEYAIMVQHINDAPQFPKEVRVSEPLASVIMKCLAKQPDDRFHSAEQLIGALAQIDTAKLSTYDVSKPKQKNIPLITSVIACAMAVVSLIVFWPRPRTTQWQAPISQAPIPKAEPIGTASISAKHLAKKALRLFVNQGKTDPHHEAERLYLTAIEAVKKEPQPDKAALEAHIRADYIHMLVTLHRKTDAIKQADELLAFIHDKTVPDLVRYVVYRNSGECYNMEPDGLPKAIELFDKAKQSLSAFAPVRDDDYYLLLENYATAYVDHGKIDMAIKVLDESVAGKDVDSEQYLSRSLRLADLAQQTRPDIFKREIKKYESARGSMKASYYTLMSIARRFEQEKKYSEAIKFARYAYEDLKRETNPTALKSDTSKILIFLANNYARERKLASARECAQEALDKFDAQLDDANRQLLRAFLGRT